MRKRPEKTDDDEGRCGPDDAALDEEDEMGDEKRRTARGRRCPECGVAHPPVPAFWSRAIVKGGAK